MKLFQNKTNLRNQIKISVIFYSINIKIATKQDLKSNSQCEKAHKKTQKVKAKKTYIETLNENVKDIYNFFGHIKAESTVETKYL